MGPTGYVVGSGTNLSLSPGSLPAPNFGELHSQGNSQLIQGGGVVIQNSSEPDYLP
jgi:hypothetical protein